jgi:pyruvate dehydrogenase E1 component alpha subunit
MKADEIIHRLLDPRNYHEPIELGDAKANDVVGYIKMMTEIRFAEEKIGDLLNQGQIKCPCHLGIGQEAIAVGVAAELRSTDRVFGTHRSHTHFLSMGCSLEELFAEVLGKASGASKGMGGSMHLWDQPKGFYGSVPIVGATIPIAVGAGLAAKLQGAAKGSRDLDVGVCYFGDGASEEGGFHESMNLAASVGIPVFFVCEHNLYSSHLHISQRQPDVSIARYAEAHRVNYRIVDGNDVIAVKRATAELLRESRQNSKPAFLEAVTYRWRGHVGPKEDDDVGVQRKDDLALWRKRDPIARLARALISRGDYTEQKWRQLDADARAKVERAAQFGIDAPYPDAAAARGMVFANPK